ncbi:MFS general substrate transporter [Marasmius fiardii PR-910]|nr:MFS general substrate transporter [Marasmius fiardii PR-910]
MANERTPLFPGENFYSDFPESTSLNAQEPVGPRTKTSSEAHDIVYERFSKREKAIITSIASYLGVMFFFVSGSFLPLIPDIAKDLKTDAEAVKQVDEYLPLCLAVSVGIFANAMGEFIGASLSSFYGRRPVYIYGLPFLIAGSLGVAMSGSIETLMAWRFSQTIGVSFGISVGAAVIGDMYRLEERGTAIGVFFAACLTGQVLAPVVGGFAARYLSWRVMQAGLGAAGLVGLVLVASVLSETSHPGTRGIDKRRAELGCDDVSFTVPNPFAAITLLRSPNIVAISVIGWTVLMTNYVILLPLPYTIAKHYGIVNQAAVGLLYAPMGLGNFVGAPFAGWLSDQVLKRILKKRGSVWCPEDRLRPALLGAAVIVPLSVLGVGVITHYVPGALGLGLNMICLFFDGFGIDMVLSPSSAYLVDIVHSRSAESVAAFRGFRALLMSISISAIAPAINRFGILWTNAISALIAWVGFGLLCIVIKHGEAMRNWVDVGYSTAETN